MSFISPNLQRSLRTGRHPYALAAFDPSAIVGAASQAIQQGQSYIQQGETYVNDATQAAGAVTGSGNTQSGPSHSPGPSAPSPTSASGSASIYKIAIGGAALAGSALLFKRGQKLLAGAALLGGLGWYLMKKAGQE